MSTPSARTGGSLDAWFKISQRGSTVRQEVVAGLTTFLAMVYSVIVVPGMLGKAGFPPDDMHSVHLRSLRGQFPGKVC